MAFVPDRSEPERDRIVLRPQNELDAHSAPAFSTAVDEALVHGAVRTIAVDLTDVRFVDSTGLGALIHARQRTADRGVAFELSHPQSQLLRLMSMTQTYQLFHWA